MNVSTAKTSTAAAVTSAPARDGAGTGAGAATDGAAFLQLLLQVSGVTGSQCLPTTASDAPGGASTPADEADPTAPDWVVPFLPPAVNAPIPLDYELPATVPGEGGPVDGLYGPVGAISDDAKPVTPLPMLLDDAGEVADADFTARLADPSRTPPLHGLEQAAASLSRVEATPGGGHAVVRTIPVPVADHRWPERVGHEIRILVDGGVQQATLRLNPEHLGPVEVRIDVVNDRANVVFGASHADTRAALNDAIPKLREMFAGAGLTLGDAGVRQDAPGANPQPLQRAATDGFVDGTEESPGSVITVSHVGLVDAYA
jgi:flagellar hook-length control protein FliK